MRSRHVFTGGHSFGGPAALLAGASAGTASLRVDVRGILLHDPALGMGADVWAVRQLVWSGALHQLVWSGALRQLVWSGALRW